MAAKLIAITAHICYVTAQYNYDPPTLQPLTSCDRTFTSKRFSISSSDWKNLNDQDIACQFKIQRSDSNVCSILLNFKQFDLIGSPDCQNEHLTVDAEKFCGNFLGFRQFPFDGNFIDVQFKGRANSPLDVSVEQISCSTTSSNDLQNCNVVSRQLRTEISSPNYPEPYPNSANCQYTVLPANPAVCRVSIYFHDFFVEESFECEKDRFLVGSEPFCGRLKNYETQRELRNNLILRFVSDSAVTDRGFRITVDQIQCENPFRINYNVNETQVKSQPSFHPEQYPPYPPRQASGTECCNRPYNTPHAILTSPGFPDGNSGVEYNCLYTIIPATPRTCRLRLHFKHFWVGEEDVFYGCINGFLEIDNQRFCGCRDDFNVVTYFNGGLKQLWYNFRGTGQRGFIIEARQEECNDGINFERFPVRNSTVDPNTEIEVFFTNITSERAVSRFLIPSDASRCYRWGLPDWFDQIRLFLLNAGVTSTCPANRPLLPPIIAPPVNPPVNPPVFPPVNPPIIAPPVNPPVFPPVNPPVFPPVNPPVFPPVNPPVFPPPVIPPVFLPPALPPVYPPLVNPVYPSVSYPPLAPAPPIYFSPNCQVWAIPQGFFQSPNYPGNYPPNQRCCFRFRQLPGFCRIQISVLDFDLEWSFKCWKDYLLLDNRVRYCGHSLQYTGSVFDFRSDGYAYVDFVSDKFYSGRGFRANFAYVPCFPASAGIESQKTEERRSSPIAAPNPPIVDVPVTYPARDDDLNLNVTPV